MVKKSICLSISISSLALVSCDSGGDSEDLITSDIVSDAPPAELAAATDLPAIEDVVEADDAIDGSSAEAIIFEQVNDHRLGVGLEALLLDERISELALEHNIFQANEAFDSGSSSIQISHVNFEDRATQVFGFGYNSIGENVAGSKGFADDVVPGQFVTGWINSAGHLANIEGGFTHTGISVSLYAFFATGLVENKEYILLHKHK